MTSKLSWKKNRASVVVNMLWCALLFFEITASAAPNVQLINSLYQSEPLIEIGSDLEEIILTARVDLEGVQFAWTLDGPGRLDGDAATRRVTYVVPENLNQETVNVTISVIVTDERGESAEESLTITLHDSTPSPPSPLSQATPTPVSTSLPEAESQLQTLLETADAYFDRTFYTEPEGNNAFAFYQQALRLDPQNAHAQARIRKMADDYKQWAETAQNKNNDADAQRYYERYRVLEKYILEELTPQPQPSPTPAVTASLSSTPEPDLPDDTIQRPGNLYAVIIGVGTYQDASIPALPLVEQNAQELFQILTDSRYGGIPEEHIMLLRGSEATEQGVKHAVGVWAREQAADEDTVLVYYAGQGLVAQESSYWVTYDADAEELYATSMNQADIVDMFARLRAQRLIVLFDAAYTHAGYFDDSLSEHVLPWEQLAGSGKMIITSTTGISPAADQNEGRNLFAETLRQGLQGLADENDDGAIEAEEIWAYLEQNIRAKSSDLENPPSPRLYGEPLSALPITFDVAKLQQQRAAREAEEQKKQLEARQQKLIEVYRSGAISAEQFKKALDILKSGTHDQILEDFLDGTLPVEIFNETF